MLFVYVMSSDSESSESGVVPSAKKFRLNSSKIFLTYPQCSVSKEDLWAYLNEFFDKFNVSNCIVAAEKHEDGSDHLHAYVDLGKKWDCKNANALDYKGFHPNMQSARSPSQVMKYVMKDGDVVFNHDPSLNYGSCASVNELESYVVTKYKERFWLVNSDRIIATWLQKRKVRSVYESPYASDSWNHCLAIQNWFNYERLSARPKCLVVIGESRLGKTKYVRSFSSRHVYFKCGWRLDDWDDDADYVVFDDWSTDDIQKYLCKRLVGVDDEVVVTDKYRGKRRIKPRPSVLVSNIDIGEEPWFDGWWRANTVLVRILAPLFK